MDAKRRRLQYIALSCMLLLLVGTFLSFFIAPRIADAQARKKYGLSDDAFVTDTARSPWVYIDEAGQITLYGDKMVGMTTLRIPNAVNGIASVKLGFILSDCRSIQTVIIPRTVVAKDFVNWRLRDFSALETLVLEEGVTDLSGCSTGSLAALRAIYIPRSAQSIPSALIKEGAAVTVYYAGTEEEWLALGKGAEAILARYTVVFETEFSAQ